MVSSNCLVCLRLLCWIRMLSSIATFGRPFAHIKYKAQVLHCFSPSEMVKPMRTLMDEHIENRDLKLSIVEFAYKSSVNRTTGKSLHEIVYDFRPRQSIDPIAMADYIESLSLYHHLQHTCTRYTKIDCSEQRQLQVTS